MKKKYLALGIALSLSCVAFPGVNVEAAENINRGEMQAIQQDYHNFAPEVQIDSGIIYGTREDNGVKVFKGIPYADTTAGENRFQPPKPVKPWSDKRDCTKFGPIAVQKEATLMGPWSSEYLDLGMNLANGRMSEDCLNLNVWSTAKAGDKQPVIVYIHGGANISGSSENDIYTGKELASQGVVYVSINYRVGIFGFLAYKDSTGDEVKGNLAIQDQIAALKWVQRNIQAFGGDPQNVTIMGQSAGSINVQHLIGSKAAAGLFKRAVALSFNSVTTEYPVMKTLGEAEKEASQALKGRTLADLRKMTPEEIMELGYNPSTVIRDTSTGTLPLKEAFATNSWNKVDMIWGGVAGDPYIFDSMIPIGDVFSPLDTLNSSSYKKKVQNRFGINAPMALQLYPEEEESLNAAKQINQDALIASYDYAGQLKEKSDPHYRTYIYYYDHILPDSEERQQKYGAFHTSDVSYWLNYYSSKAGRSWTKTDYKLGEQMSGYIINFAKNGNPNGHDVKLKELPLWKNVEAGSDISYLHIGDEIRYETMPKEKAQFWKKIWRIAPIK